MRSSLLFSTLVLLMGGAATAKVFAKLSPGESLLWTLSAVTLMLNIDLDCNVLFHKYNVEKANCMAGEQVQTIAFTKIENTGPFCLRTYKDSNCEEETDHQQFDIIGSKLLS